MIPPKRAISMVIASCLKLMRIFFSLTVCQLSTYFDNWASSMQSISVSWNFLLCLSRISCLMWLAGRASTTCGNIVTKVIISKAIRRVFSIVKHLCACTLHTFEQVTSSNRFSDILRLHMKTLMYCRVITSHKCLSFTDNPSTYKFNAFRNIIKGKHWGM